MLRSAARDLAPVHNRKSCSIDERNPPRSSVQYHNFCRPAKSKIEGAKYIHDTPGLICVVEFLKNKLYFATLITGRREPRSTSDVHFFSIDEELVYNNFYNDFGPLNLACLYKYCCKLNKKLRNPANKNRRIVHYTSQNQEKRANAAYLISSYAVLYLQKNPREALALLTEEVDSQPLKPFQDASMGISVYHIRLQDCLSALHKAVAFGFFNFEDFDLAEYEKYEQTRNGDLNWTVPQKFIAFTGPSTELGTCHHPPERYLEYFARNGVVAVVRLNRKSYEASRFTRAGIAHYEMFMPDGSAPPRYLLEKFLQLAENTNGAIAVHCKAGLGRTGSLIAAYLVKHYGMTARETIAWLRICRPGSVIGQQQAWLEGMENELRRAGHQYRVKHLGDGNMIWHHKRGIYSVIHKLERKMKVGRGTEILKKTQKAAGDREKVSNAENRVWRGEVGPVAAGNNPARPGITGILGKLCMTRAAVPTKPGRLSEVSGKLVSDSRCRGRVNEAVRDSRTQGDRLNEIKVERKKRCPGELY